MKKTLENLMDIFGWKIVEVPKAHSWHKEDQRFEIHDWWGRAYLKRGCEEAARYTLKGAKVALMKILRKKYEKMEMRKHQRIYLGD